MLMNELLSLQNVTIRYPDQTSFNSINLSISQGGHLAIVGNDEHVKNALMDAIAGKVAIINGKKTLHLTGNAELLAETPGAHRHKLIASVSARHSFKNLSHTNDFYYQQRFNSCDSENSETVQEYLQSISGVNEGHPWDLETIIDKLHLHQLLGEGLIKLSNGETKRVLIAAALIQNPVLLVLYNPLGGLDVESRKEITTLINDIAATGITIVLSSQPGEIPSAIKQLAVVNKDKAIKMLTADTYHAEENVPGQIEPDEQEMWSLLSTKKPLHYNTIVQLNNVVIRYGEKTILDHINWTILQGERWALVGHNGAGKSTLLSLINADNPQAFANNIVLFDRQKGSGESIWDIKRNIGFFSPELYQYFPVDTSVLQAVESGFYDTIGLFRQSNPARVSIAMRWMKILMVDKYANRLLRNLSPVDQRLCLLARALVKSPPLLILDEPFQGFDEAQKTYCKQVLDTICRLSNTTLLFVSHYTEEMPSCISKVFRLKDGRQVD